MTYGTLNSGAEFSIRLGKRLRELRERAGLTQDKAAERAGITGKYWGEVERGSVAVSALVLHRMAGALGSSAADIMETEHVGSRHDVLNRIATSLDQADDGTLRLYLRLLRTLEH